jgi:hypothetical protein
VEGRVSHSVHASAPDGTSVGVAVIGGAVGKNVVVGDKVGAWVGGPATHTQAHPAKLPRHAQPKAPEGSRGYPSRTPRRVTAEYRVECPAEYPAEYPVEYRVEYPVEYPEEFPVEYPAEYRVE